MEFYRLLCIDPGTKVTGIALFEVWTDTKEGIYVHSEALKAEASDNWFDRLDKMLTKVVDEALYPYLPDIVLIEQPRHFFGTSKGQGAMNSGAIEKVAALVFAIWGAVHIIAGDEKEVECVLVPVNKWKGNVPKEVTQKRILTHWGIHFTGWTTDDEADAIGIGDWYIRKQLGFTPKKTT